MTELYGSERSLRFLTLELGHVAPIGAARALSRAENRHFCREMVTVFVIIQSRGLRPLDNSSMRRCSRIIRPQLRAENVVITCLIFLSRTCRKLPRPRDRTHTAQVHVCFAIGSSKSRELTRGQFFLAIRKENQTMRPRALIFLCRQCCFGVLPSCRRSRQRQDVPNPATLSAYPCICIICGTLYCRTAPRLLRGV